MSEEEARTKWCPYRREIVWFDSTGNQTPALSHNDGSLPCIASDCMMWQWDGDEKEYTFTKPWEDGWKYEPYRSEVTLRFKDRWVRPNHSRKGYCGLGGKP